MRVSWVSSLLLLGLTAACGRTGLNAPDGGTAVDAPDGGGAVTDGSVDEGGPPLSTEWLAFQVQPSSGVFGETELRAVDIAGRFPPRVVNSAPYKSLRPGRFAWSPDGAALAYEAIPIALDGAYSGPTELFVTRFDDPDRAPIRVGLPSDVEGNIDLHGWSSDSKSIRWTIIGSGPPVRYYWMNVSDELPEPQLVHDNPGGGLLGAWSPDSYRFVYELPVYLSGVEASQLFLVDLESGAASNARPVHPELRRNAGICDWWWSSSSRWVLYAAEAERSQCDLYAVRVEDGVIGSPLRLNPNLGTAEQMHPAPGSERVLFAARPEGSSLELFVVDLAQGEPVSPTLIEQAIPAGSTFSFGLWIDSERFIYETRQEHTPTRWFADLRHGRVSLRPLDLRVEFGLVSSIRGDSVQLLYPACLPESCDVREWTWLDATNGISAVALGLFCESCGAALSPDGRRAILDARLSLEGGQEHDIYQLEFENGVPGPAVRVDQSRRTLISGRPRFVWSPTGNAFAFLNGDERLAWAEANTGRVHVISDGDGRILNFAWRPR